MSDEQPSLDVIDPNGEMALIEHEFGALVPAGVAHRREHDLQTKDGSYHHVAEDDKGRWIYRKY